jgi:hexokinase
MLDLKQSVLNALEMLLMLPSMLRRIRVHLLKHWRLGKSQSQQNSKSKVEPKTRTLEEFVLQVVNLFTANLQKEQLLDMSKALQQRYREKLVADPYCMLPSYSHTLPTGEEKGKVLAVDVGGSTLRVSLVELAGRNTSSPQKILSIRSWKIEDTIKTMKGRGFFDWMAERIGEMLDEKGLGKDIEPLPMGLSWSFPIE